MAFRIRLVSACRRTELCVGDYHFSVEFAPEDANALLCEWAPDVELLSFSGPKAWYCCEATSASLFKKPDWKSFREQIRPEEFLFHAHPDVRFRVPHTNLGRRRSLEHRHRASEQGCCYHFQRWRFFVAAQSTNGVARSTRYSLSGRSVWSAQGLGNVS